LFQSLHSHLAVPQQQIEGHVELEREADGTALKFEGRDQTVARKFRFRAGVHVEERQSAAAVEGVEVAAGIGDSVHFMERVGEECDARRGAQRETSCASASAARNAPRNG
jgi:hypothetical protein